jgi:hypothetical protein
VRRLLPGVPLATTIGSPTTIVATTSHAPAASSPHGSARPAMPFGGGSPEQSPAAGGSAASSGSGASVSFAVLMSLLALAAICFSRLRTAPVAWRSVAVVSLIERPG